jgi:hypothetical protein
VKYHTSTTEYNCGIDLHARQMYVCVMDRQGKKLVHTNVKDNDFSFFLKLVEPYKHSLTVCCECMFGWYWLADACQQAGLTFALAHALYLRAISGGKNKNDRIDSEKLTHLLRSPLKGLCPYQVTDHSSCVRSNTFGLRWQVSNPGRFDWDLRPGAEPLTKVSAHIISALAYKNRAREIPIPNRDFLRSKRGGTLRRHTLGTSQ